MRHDTRGEAPVPCGMLQLPPKSNTFSRRTGSMMPPQSGDFPDGPTVVRRVTRPQPACRLVSASSLEGLLTRNFTGVRREAAALGDHSAARPGRMNEGGIAQTEQRAPLLHPPSSGKQHGMQGRSVRASAARPLHHPAARRPARATEADFGQLCWLGTAEREVPPR